jgi:DNA helicase HerA-like ATPase
LELLFSEIYDPHYNLSSIVNYIYEFWPIKNNNANTISEERKGNEEKVVKTWTDLFNFKGYPGEIITHKSSLLQFQGYVQRFRRSSLFIDKKVTSTYLGKEIKQIRSGDVFVIDIAMLSELEQQAFVIGDVMKSIDEMFSLRAETINLDDGSSSNSKRNKKPKYLLIFIDEINRFLPKSRQAGRMNTVAEQIMKTLIAGRSRGTILFSAQQFKSTVDYALHENTGMHITAKVGLSELSTAPYNIIDESTKMNIMRLNKGELVLIHSAFRHPIKITFPKAQFKKP